jgi:hypothetical protein
LECANSKTGASSHLIGKPSSANLSPSQGLSLIFLDMYRPVFIADIVTEANGGQSSTVENRRDYTFQPPKSSREYLPSSTSRVLPSTPTHAGNGDCAVSSPTGQKNQSLGYIVTGNPLQTRVALIFDVTLSPEFEADRRESMNWRRLFTPVEPALRWMF